MTRTGAILAVVATGLAGAVVLYGSGGLHDAAANGAAVRECDSCSARKKDLLRLRDAARSPADKGQ